MSGGIPKYAVGGATRPDSFSGMRPNFAAALDALVRAAPPEVGLRVGSGYRSPERQAQLYAAAVQKYGSPEAARKWVAPPGRSQHGAGSAADLKFDTPAARAWAHANAGQYGLSFPMGHEPWHVELAGARGGGAFVPKLEMGATTPAQAAFGSSEPVVGAGAPAFLPPPPVYGAAPTPFGLQQPVDDTQRVQKTRPVGQVGTGILGQAAQGLILGR